MPGDCIVTRHYGGLTEDDYITIDQADPVVLISSDMVEELRRDALVPEVELNSDVMTINAANRRAVYRIDFDSFNPLTHCYVMRWPD